MFLSGGNTCKSKMYYLLFCPYQPKLSIYNCTFSIISFCANSKYSVVFYLLGIYLSLKILMIHFITKGMNNSNHSRHNMSRLQNHKGELYVKNSISSAIHRVTDFRNVNSVSRSCFSGFLVRAC